MYGIRSGSDPDTASHISRADAPRPLCVDRREHPRALVPLSAIAIVENRKVGTYSVANLSAGGALLMLGPSLPAGTSLQLLLDGPGAEQLTIAAVVLRTEPSTDRDPMIAVRFHGVSARFADLIQTLVLRSLEQASGPGVLVVPRGPALFAAIASDLAALGCHVAAATTRLQIIRQAGDPELRLRAVIVELSADPREDCDVLDFLAEAFPRLLRVAVCARPRSPHCMCPAVRAQAVLVMPWTRSQLGATIGRHVSERPESLAKLGPPV